MAKSYLHFWGVRGSHASPFDSHLQVGGNTSCVEINVNGHILICDAGTGIITLGNKLAAQQNIKEVTVILTHYHWDHICGLPFFEPAFIPGWKINFYGPGESIQEMKQNLDSQMQAPYFPINTENWMANINYIPPSTKKIRVGDMVVKHHCVHHPGITYGYTVDTGKQKIIYVSDNECQFLDKSIKMKMTEFSEEEQTFLKEINRGEYEYELKSIKDADILIHDSQYTPEDYEIKRGWGHSCYVDVVNSSIDAGVKQLYLFHHDPSNDDSAIEEIHEKSINIIQSRNSSLKCFIAREGLEVELN